MSEIVVVERWRRLWLKIGGSNGKAHIERKIFKAKEIKNLPGMDEKNLGGVSGWWDEEWTGRQCGMMGGTIADIFKNQML